MKARLTVEIECGVETCFVGVGEPCGMVDRGRARCLHFRKALEMSSGWYQRLPDCLAQAVPVPSAEEDQAAGEHECTGGCEVMTCDGYDGEGGCGDSFCVALRLDHDCLKAAPDSAAPPAEEGER